MAIVKTGQGVVDIRGSISGVYFSRDKSGLHQSAKPRRIRQLSTAQLAQRNAFRKARTYTKDPRWVSYYIYRALNNLPFVFDAIVTGDPAPDCTGTYVLSGQFRDKDYYERTDSAWLIWWDGFTTWNISSTLGQKGVSWWSRNLPNIEGLYSANGAATGTATVGLHVQPPPTDYQPPKL